MENLDQDLINAGTSQFNLPHDVISLPTGGIFYKNKQKTVKVGYLTANDENLIVDAIQRNNDSLILTLIREKLYEPELKVKDLMESDIQAILIFLRNTSFGPEYKFALKDPATGKEFSTTIALDELDFTKPQIQPNSEGLFELKLPKTGAVVKLKPLTYFESLELEKMAETYPQGRVAPIVTWRLNKQIVELNGSPDKMQISTFVDKLPINDSKFIRNFIRENVPSIDLTRNIKAPSGEMVTVNIAFGVEFFRPFF